MFLSAFCGSLVVRGIAGRIASDCAYFGMVVGSSVPPGTGTARTRSIPGTRKKARPAAAPPPRMMKPRREMVLIACPSVASNMGAQASTQSARIAAVQASLSVRLASPFPPKRRSLSTR
jgi:hypothetical protein